MTTTASGPECSGPPPQFPNPRLHPTMDVPEAARWMGMSRAAAYQAAAEGTLPVLRFGKSVRVQTQLLADLLGLKLKD